MFFGSTVLNLSDNLNNSFEYAKQLFSDFGRLIILVVFEIIPFVNWIVVGYGAQILKESPENNTLPNLEKYGDLLIKGAKIFLVSLIYMIVPLALVGSGVASFALGMRRAWTMDDMTREFVPRMFLGGGVGLILMIIGGILAFLIMIILGLAIAHMIKTDRLEKAFALGELLGIARRIGYGKYLAWIVLIAVISAVVGGVSGSIPVIGWLVRAIVNPALTIFFSRSLAILYHDGTG